jgi:predicted metal-dependent HD superfamily phosphohydrolase
VNIGVASELIDRVQQLILATKGHQIDPNDLDRCIFLDADLAILGADPVIYQVYARSIRREYSWVSDTAYQTGRIRVLASFLQRDRLYYTDLLFDELESIARSNMQQEIDLLHCNL